MVRRRVIAWRRQGTRRDRPQPPPQEQPDGIEDGESERSRASRRWSWPQKIAAVVLPLIAAWAVTYFAPGVWESIKGATGVEPLTVIVLNHEQFDAPIEADLNEEFVVPTALSSWNSATWPYAQLEWAYKHGGADADNTGIRLVVTGTSAKKVTIQEVAVRIVERDEPLRGLTVTEVRGGLSAPRHLLADLDNGEVSWSDEAGKAIAPMTLWVNNSEQEIIDLVAFTEECFCLWVVDLTYTTDDETKTLTVPKKGQTFRTTATSRAAVYTVIENTCEDYADLKPTLCDAPPPGWSDEVAGGPFVVNLK
jgi:hypothetical protein